MNILEGLESLNISEECFGDIISIVEEYINELNDETVQNVANRRAYDTGVTKIRELLKGRSKSSMKYYRKFNKLKKLLDRRAERTGRSIDNKETLAHYRKGFDNALSYGWQKALKNPPSANEPNK